LRNKFGWYLRKLLGLFPKYNLLGSGFYTEADFIEILQYAHRRHIEVIPEIDVPGHARAAIKSMGIRAERLLAEGKTDEANQYLLHDPEDQSIYNSAQNYNDNVLCICQESTYNFLEVVVSRVVKLFEMADVPLRALHTGGDEVPGGAWEKSPICQE